MGSREGEREPGSQFLSFPPARNPIPIARGSGTCPISKRNQSPTSADAASRSSSSATSPDFARSMSMSRLARTPMSRPSRATAPFTIHAWSTRYSRSSLQLSRSVSERRSATGVAYDRDSVILRSARLRPSRWIADAEANRIPAIAICFESADAIATSRSYVACW